MADFSGKWTVTEWDDDSFVKFFAAMGAPDPNMALGLFKTVETYEIIDKGDTVILRIPDPASEGGERDIPFKVGEESEALGPVGVPVKKFTIKEGNKLIFHETAPNGQKNITVRELQGDKMILTKTHEGTGVTGRCVFKKVGSKL
ncbi:PREDICTED: uncharacterized protein LOC109483113 [Branchiostoma belcheri]|uniref:Uncharacterized protein LOC109483113 n=1 Tax=Branchiostoma belcheri TaxID=7741 RepID=A0A6P5A5W6_BRABE|nr:PREDICTED: uncharacterized protein LOC109483113 [Branchiostoma belcheri]KAI8505828.1 hypothetical protein Bbelb_161810 [Branchiostoma belcheri]